MRARTINETDAVCVWCEARPRSMHAALCDANEASAAVENIADDLRNLCDEGVFDVTVVTGLYGMRAATAPVLVTATLGGVRRVLRGTLELGAMAEGFVSLHVSCPELGSLVDQLVADAGDVVANLQDDAGVPWCEFLPLDESAIGWCHHCGEPITAEDVELRGTFERGEAMFCDSDCIDDFTTACVDNARLYAAAPELLAACAHLMSFAAAWADAPDGWDPAGCAEVVMDHLRAAVAKATEADALI